jgi:hypothetical protein
MKWLGYTDYVKKVKHCLIRLFPSLITLPWIVLGPQVPTEWRLFFYLATEWLKIRFHENLKKLSLDSQT